MRPDISFRALFAACIAIVNCLRVIASPLIASRAILQPSPSPSPIAQGFDENGHIVASITAIHDLPAANLPVGIAHDEQLGWMVISGSTRYYYLAKEQRQVQSGTLSTGHQVTSLGFRVVFLSGDTQHLTEFTQGAEGFEWLIQALTMLTERHNWLKHQYKLEASVLELNVKVELEKVRKLVKGR
ncbi:hypothetical protein J3R30DRAFT_3509159 [Lentinula aciculospora]|uniref:Uncharacterized protein n=1 Tax=Lentinula aciculospora TaxID=153920 RepID=A0A9W9A655_9AGAR|nr:hypothetical protein J3R30DRAFT_3509159 [Lentinula aciculospora]